jgi:hypothetical protein
MDYSIYADNLIRLAENYANCTNEVNEFKRALASGDETLVKAAQEVLEVSLELSELAEKYDLNAETTANFADRLAENNEDLEDGEKLTAK